MQSREVEGGVRDLSQTKHKYWMSWWIEGINWEERREEVKDIEE